MAQTLDPITSLFLMFAISAAIGVGVSLLYIIYIMLEALFKSAFNFGRKKYVRLTK